jgi:hypothetical protein
VPFPCHREDQATPSDPAVRVMLDLTELSRSPGCGSQILLRPSSECVNYQRITGIFVRRTSSFRPTIGPHKCSLPKHACRADGVPALLSIFECPHWISPSVILLCLLGRREGSALRTGISLIPAGIECYCLACQSVVWFRNVCSPNELSFSRASRENASEEIGQARNNNTQSISQR